MTFCYKKRKKYICGAFRDSSYILLFLSAVSVNVTFKSFNLSFNSTDVGLCLFLYLKVCLITSIVSVLTDYRFN